MASTRRKTTKGGRDFYEIRVSPGREQPQFSRRWYVPEGWSQRAIDRELAKVAAEFERQCKAGEVRTKAQEREIKAQMAREAAKHPTLQEYGERVFMPAKVVTISENTRAGFQGYLDNRIYPALGSFKLRDITPANLSGFLSSLQAEGLAHGTVLRCYTILRSLFKMAYMNDVIDRNPLDKVERPRPRKDEIQAEKVDAYTAKELAYILECAEREPLHWKLLFHLLIDTGLRRGECLGIQWQDIDFKAGTVTIRRSISYTPQKGVYVDTPKTGRERTIDVAPEIISMLRQHRRVQAQKAISAFVFTHGTTPEPMNPQTVTRHLGLFGKKYGIEGLHPHKLRHSFASVAITSGADIASVSEKLGHADKSMTLKMYTHADQESIKRAGQVFRDAVKKA